MSHCCCRHTLPLDQCPINSFWDCYVPTRRTVSFCLLSSKYFLPKLVAILNTDGCLCLFYRPYLWGPAAAAHYSIQRGIATRIAKLPEAAEVLTLLNSKKLLHTAYNFPIELKLNGTEICQESEDYDPRFILLSLVHVLSSEYEVQCGKFSQSGAVSILFAALSSPCSEVFHKEQSYYSFCIYEVCIDR